MIPRKYIHDNRGLKTRKTRCKPPQDCFSCKYPDCVAGTQKRTTKEEKEYYKASQLIEKRGTKC